MNERIRELWYQAVQPHTGDSWAEQTAFMAKFAELIVQECVICAEREWIRNGDTEHNRAVTKVIESIKQNFGVEE